jgi:signal transduction histidine kinase
VSLAQARNGGAPEAVVRIEDTGIGISAEMLPRVFDLFTQADHSLAHTQGGLGIGLSLVRSLVELHGGRVVAVSEGLGKGSEFAVYLPLAEKT